VNARDDLVGQLSAGLNDQADGPGHDAPYVSAEFGAESVVIDGHVNLVALADAIIAAGWRAPGIAYIPCDDVHPKYGRCAMWLGHDGTHWTHEYDDERRPDGSHPWDY